MNNDTLIIAFVITLPIQALIIYAICRDIEEYREEKRRKQISLNNLLGKDKIYVDLTDEDMFLIENLATHEGCESIEQYIRNEIKKLKGA